MCNRQSYDGDLVMVTDAYPPLDARPARDLKRITEFQTYP